MTNRSLVRPSGFTLIELLVVIAIIAVLAAIAIPIITNVINAANRTKCMSNMRSIYTYLQGYAQEHNGQMPMPGSSYKSPGVNFTKSLEPYIPTLGERKVFYCPAHKGEKKGVLYPYVYTDANWNTGGISYHYYSFSNKVGIPLRVMDAGNQLLMSDKFNNSANNPIPVDSSTKKICTHPDGLNLMRLNGAIEFSKYNKDIRTW